MTTLRDERPSGKASDARRRANLLETVEKAVAAGICVVPPVEDGSKRPNGLWKKFQTERPSALQLQQWYKRATGIGLITGSVSGGLECLELDQDLLAEFESAAEALGLGPLLDRVKNGYLSRSPSGGWHLLYFCDEIRPNTKLARRHRTTDEFSESDRKAIAEAATKGREHQPIQVLFETRGEGGFVVEAPSYGKVHPTGKPYELVRGGFDSVATIASAERESLWNLVRTFDRIPEQPKPGAEPRSAGQKTQGEISRPGDDYNASVTWREVMAGHGWTEVFTRGDAGYWRRPGKTEDWSATVNHNGCGLLKVFTSSSVFEPGKTYTKFGAYAALNHGGDHGAAAKSLASQGYGKKAGPSSPINRVNGRVGVNGHAKPPAEPTTNGHVETNGNRMGLGLDLGGEERPKGFRLTDLGNGERLIHRHGINLRYCHPWKKWLCFDGKRWAIDSTAAARRWAKDTVRSIYREAAAEEDEKRRDAIASHAQDSEKRDRLAAMLNVAEMDVPILPEMMDQDPWAFNAMNGTIDLRTGKLRPHRREDLITQLCRLRFDPNARCPLWEETIRLFLPQTELAEYFQRVCGYALCGVVEDHILPICFGDGSNGKSTLLGTLMEVFGGDYAMKTMPDLLMAKGGESHPTERADLFGKRLVVAIETEDGRRLNETMVKELTGGDKIRARRMREDPWEFTPTHTLIMATNHKPVIKGGDTGIWRRLRLLPFNVQVEGKSADKAMPQKLKAEYPGILAWCVRGCLAWQQHGLDEPQVVTEATGEYRKEQDALGRFLEEFTMQVRGARVKAGVLYARYKQWTEDATERNVLSMKAFGQAIEKRGIEKKTSNGVWYEGIGLRAEGEVEEGSF